MFKKIGQTQQCELAPDNQLEQPHAHVLRAILSRSILPTTASR